MAPSLLDISTQYGGGRFLTERMKSQATSCPALLVLNGLMDISVDFKTWPKPELLLLIHVTYFIIQQREL